MNNLRLSSFPVTLVVTVHTSLWNQPVSQPVVRMTTYQALLGPVLGHQAGEPWSLPAWPMLATPVPSLLMAAYRDAEAERASGPHPQKAGPVGPISKTRRQTESQTTHL